MQQLDQGSGRSGWWYVFWAAIAAVVLAAGAFYVFLAAIGNGFEHNVSGLKRPPRQTCLRTLARAAPDGGAAYWIGRDFHGLPAHPACAWDDSFGGTWVAYQPYSSDSLPPGVNYRRIVQVYTVPVGGAAVKPGYFRHAVYARKHVGHGQDVVLVFQGEKPSADLIRETRAAIRPIPRNVTYPD